MELKDFFEIWDRFETSKAKEMELDMNGIHFSIKKDSDGTCNNTAENSEKAQEITIKKPDEKIDKSIKGVKAPLVGTFYLAASPEEEPFVKVGDYVHSGDVVGIIEAMKLMNEVKATQDGRVKEILVEDETMVEYGQTLIVIE